MQSPYDKASRRLVYVTTYSFGLLLTAMNFSLETIGFSFYLVNLNNASVIPYVMILFAEIFKEFLLIGHYHKQYYSTATPECSNLINRFTRIVGKLAYCIVLLLLLLSCLFTSGSRLSKFGVLLEYIVTV